MSELQEQFDDITVQAYELRKAEKYEEALKLIQPFADKGLPIAQHIVATFHYWGEGIPEDLVKASEWLQKAADQDCTEAMSMLGHQYIYGVGIPKDEKLGEDLLLKAGAKYDGYAYYVLGRYFHNIGNRFKASGYYVLGVNLDNRDCMRGRADMNMESKSYKDALDLYVQALKLGCIKSTFNAATMFDNALGCEQNLELAFMLYKTASDAGDFMATHNVGTFYYNGKHVEQDKQKAFEFYLKGADQGVGISQHCIGLMYFNGDLTQDLDVALSWLNKSLENGYSDSARFIDEIQKIKDKNFVEH
jgi:TPR repeat protein